MLYDSLAAAPPRAVRLVAVAGGIPIWAIGSSSDIGPGLASTSPHRNSEGAGTALTAAKSFGWGGTSSSKAGGSHTSPTSMDSSTSSESTSSWCLAAFALAKTLVAKTIDGGGESSMASVEAVPDWACAIR